MIKKILKVAAVVGLLMGVYGLYLFNMPHRNAEDIEAEFILGSSELALQFIENPVLANETYLADDGDSKVSCVIPSWTLL